MYFSLNKQDLAKRGHKFVTVVINHEMNDRQLDYSDKSELCMINPYMYSA